jgi:hypothetical protein
MCSTCGKCRSWYASDNTDRDRPLCQRNGSTCSAFAPRGADLHVCECKNNKKM